MAMTSNFLALDTSTNTGLVVLKYAGQIYSRVQEEPREHNRFLLAMIQEVLTEAKIQLTDLDALVCGCGPGSFVGVRLGVAVMQGLAYASKKPVYALSSLALQAQAFFRLHPDYQEVLIAHDARMQALYLGHYRKVQGVAVLIGAEQLIPLVTVSSISHKDLTVSGNAAQYLAAATQIIGTPPLHAQDLAEQACASLQQKALSADKLQPVYFNDEANWQKHN